MYTEEQVKALKAALEDQIKVNQDMQEGLARIAQKQQRDRLEKEVKFAVETDDGEILHAGDSYERAYEAAKFYDNGRVVTWTETPKKYVSPANEKIEGN